MARIIPSPDWFIGIDSFDLCVNGNWLDSITIEVSQNILTTEACISMKYTVMYKSQMGTNSWNNIRN